MASRSSGISGIQLEIELMDAGKRLLLLPSSCSELLNVLAHMERILSCVQQLPSESMKYALHPIIEALIAKELVRHHDTDVNILVACCICEILRIMAPNTPYNHQQMKGFFELATMSFEKLSSSSGGCYTKMIKVLKTFSNVRLPVLMMDLQLDKLVVRLFKQFLIVADSNSCEVVHEMEKIMTMIIEESEKPKVELVGLLVMSVRNCNQIKSPGCWQLGEKVLKNCATQLKPHLVDFVRKMGIPLLNYSKMLAHICNGVTENEGINLVNIHYEDEKKHENKTLSVPSKDKTEVKEKCKRRKLNPLIHKTQVYDDIGKEFLAPKWKEHDKKPLLLSDDPPTPSKSEKEENCKRAFTPIKKEALEMVQYGENLVGRKIKVWWPLDQIYYEGLVASFDQSTRKHKICYNDGDEEILNLMEEQWELVENALPRKVSSPESCTNCVKVYKVKNSYEPILEAIFMKHGDIADECVFKTTSVRASFLEVICEVVTQLETNDDKNIISKMEEIERKVLEAEKANIRVLWLRSHLEALKKTSLLMETKAKTSMAKKAAKMDLREICAEFMAAKERCKEAKRCVKVLDLVEKKLKNSILESKTEKYLWAKPYL